MKLKKVKKEVTGIPFSEIPCGQVFRGHNDALFMKTNEVKYNIYNCVSLENGIMAKADSSVIFEIVSGEFVEFVS